MSIPPIIYKGDGSFLDLFEPVSGKSEWGMDTLTRVMAGAQENLVAFVETLAQGATHSFNGNTYYLQSWEPVNEQVFPKITLLYKGLIDGIPEPFVSGRTVEQSSSQTTDTAVSITYFDFKAQGSVTKDVMGTANRRYLTRESTYKYITSSRPTSPTYVSLDVPMDVIYLESIITTDAGVNFASNAPAALATALAPAITTATTTQTMPVFGTIYFENEDVVIQYST